MEHQLTGIDDETKVGDGIGGGVMGHRRIAVGGHVAAPGVKAGDKVELIVVHGEAVGRTERRLIAISPRARWIGRGRELCRRIIDRAQEHAIFHRLQHGPRAAPAVVSVLGSRTRNLKCPCNYFEPFPTGRHGRSILSRAGYPDGEDRGAGNGIRRPAGGPVESGLGVWRGPRVGPSSTEGGGLPLNSYWHPSMGAAKSKSSLRNV